MSFVSDRAGAYRLRVAARASPVRYRLRLDQHRPANEQDRRRLDAHRLWRAGMHSYGEGSPDQLRASVEKFEQALTALGAIADREGEAITLGAISAARYRLSDAPRGTAAATRALEIWKQLGREREEAIALSDIGLLAYLAYDHPTRRSRSRPAAG